MGSEKLLTPRDKTPYEDAVARLIDEIHEIEVDEDAPTELQDIFNDLRAAADAVATEFQLQQINGQIIR